MEKQQNGDHSWTLAFYQEPANQSPRLLVSGPRKDANPSVNEVTQLQRVRDLVHGFDIRGPSVLLAVVKLHHA